MVFYLTTHIALGQVLLLRRQNRLTEMSTHKRALLELSQPTTTPSRRAPSTPHALGTIQQRTGTRLRSARSVRHVDATTVRPTSARGILRRLAKVTAATTKRRIVTPNDKENVAPQEDSGEEADVKKPWMNFNIEESIEEDSEVLVAPTPSAVLDDTEDEDEQPTITFLGQVRDVVDNGHSRELLVPQSDSALQDDRSDADIEDGNSTYLTERGRRAISEEPTRMSRYSFGSIRMSDFGTELENRRESDRQHKLPALEAEDDYGEGFNPQDHVQLGGETENLRNLRQSSPHTFVSADEDSPELSVGANDTFRLEIPDAADTVNAQERAVSGDHPQLADSSIMVGIEDNRSQQLDDDLQELEVAPAASAGSNRRQTLLESVAATARTRPKKKLRMNQRGNMVPCLPSSLIKRIVHNSQEQAGKRKTTLGKDHMKALEQASEWFFEQVGEDLEAYSQHGRRKKRVSEDDVLLLMRRQRVLQNSGELLDMAKQWLPRELLNELDIPDRP